MFVVAFCLDTIDDSLLALETTSIILIEYSPGASRREQQSLVSPSWMRQRATAFFEFRWSLGRFRNRGRAGARARRECSVPYPHTNQGGVVLEVLQSRDLTHPPSSFSHLLVSLSRWLATSTSLFLCMSDKNHTIKTHCGFLFFLSC